MSEHWKSTPKYWCKHCSTYVKDTPFERKQHESTGRHQGNLKRFLRDIQNKHERDERDRDRAKAEVERLNTKVGSNSAPFLRSIHSTPSPSTATKLQPSVVDRKRQMAQLADMGIQIPDEERRDLALAGQWKTVSQNIIEEPLPEEPLSTGVRKRKYEGQEEEEEADEIIQRRGWGASTKTYPATRKSEIDELLFVDKMEATDKGVKAEDTDEDVKPPENRELDSSLDTARVSGIEGGKDVKADVSEAVVVPLFKKRRPKRQVT